jgi:ubiquitin-conjugating enzyme E2 J2
VPTHSGGGAVGSNDEDLTKRKKGKASKQTQARLRKELSSIKADPPPYVHVRCESNSLMWSFLIQGPPDSAYEGGWYWGKLEVSNEYPFWPPLIRILTPSGRFEADQWLCRTLSDYHPEGWQPSWNLAGLLMALLTLMVADAFTPGALHPPMEISERRRLARESLAWNKRQLEFVRDFPDIDLLVASAALASSKISPALQAS